MVRVHARNAGKVAFSDFEVQPLRRSCVSIAQNAGKVGFSDFEVQPLQRYSACPSRGMLVKLRLCILAGDLLQVVLQRS